MYLGFTVRFNSLISFFFKMALTALRLARELCKLAQTDLQLQCTDVFFSLITDLTLIVAAGRDWVTQ